MTSFDDPERQTSADTRPPHSDPGRLWTDAALKTVQGYRHLIDDALRQLTDTEVFTRPVPHVNSVAVILNHLAGNLRSRWTDFLTTDGEKPDRHRDQEFQEPVRDRTRLMESFDSGWRCLETAIRSLDDAAVTQTVRIRGEPHPVPDAVLRSLTHIAWHVGQILMIARMVHQGEWKWLTIAPGASQNHNARTWGTSEARAALTPQRKDSASPPS